MKIPFTKIDNYIVSKTLVIKDYTGKFYNNPEASGIDPKNKDILKTINNWYRSKSIVSILLDEEATNLFVNFICKIPLSHSGATYKIAFRRSKIFIKIGGEIIHCKIKLNKPVKYTKLISGYLLQEALKMLKPKTLLIEKTSIDIMPIFRLNKKIILAPCKI